MLSDNKWNLLTNLTPFVWIFFLSKLRICMSDGLVEIFLQKISTSTHTFRLSSLQYQWMSSFKLFDPTEENSLFKCHLIYFAPKDTFYYADALSRRNMNCFLLRKGKKVCNGELESMFSFKKEGKEICEWVKSGKKKFSFINCGLNDHQLDVTKYRKWKRKEQLIMASR